MKRMIEVVCGVILDSTGNVLACQRGLDRHLGGFWEFPGGKVDTGETPEVALKRELQEELTIDVKVVGRLEEIVEWNDGKISIRLTGFYCTITKGIPIANEHKEIRWCPISALHGLNWAEADIPLVEEVVRG